MFRWYAESDICYAFLCDVSSHKRSLDSSYDPWRSAFRRAKWFPRGWTLQELLAPKSVKFYSTEGSVLGDKSTLEQDVHEITGVSSQALHGAPLSTFTRRGAWAGQRIAGPQEVKTKLTASLASSKSSLFPITVKRQNASVRLKREIAQASGEQIMTISSPMRS